MNLSEKDPLALWWWENFTALKILMPTQKTIWKVIPLLFRGDFSLPGRLVRPLQAYHCHPYNVIVLLLWHWSLHHVSYDNLNQAGRHSRIVTRWTRLTHIAAVLSDCQDEWRITAMPGCYTPKLVPPAWSAYKSWMSMLGNPSSARSVVVDKPIKNCERGIQRKQKLCRSEEWMKHLQPRSFVKFWSGRPLTSSCNLF